ncbi:hypothetical protein PC120_g11602 [Phytophthora cactorum]|nr:hypothetical protein PC120_g11602 [Phytophthora cactorum]
MDMLESDGWTVKFGRINSQSVCWLRKYYMELLLVKCNQLYFLKATAVVIYRVPSLEAGEQCSQNDSKKIVLRKKTSAASLGRDGVEDMNVFGVGAVGIGLIVGGSNVGAAVVLTGVAVVAPGVYVGVAVIVSEVIEYDNQEISKSPKYSPSRYSTLA